jgi:beta-glucosidase
MHGHTNLLTEVLKEELGFSGFILSDWKGVDQLGPATPAEYQGSIVKAVNAGIDMVMIPDRYITYTIQARLATQAGDIPLARLDDAVRRILTVKFEKGLFERPYTDRRRFSMVGSPEHRELARECVARSLVLLKNEGNLLPIPKNLTRIHVAGKNADNLGYQCGGWTYSWQGESNGDNLIGTTILEAIQNTVSSSTTVTYSFDGTGAAGADLAIAVIGETPYAEFLGDSDNLRPLNFDFITIANLQNAGVPVVVVLVSGRPMMLQPEVDTWDTLVAAWLPGTEGQGVADVLFGDVYPSGRLPVTWPASNAQVPINIGDPVYEPRYAFQEGQSYRPPLDLSVAGDDLIFSWPSGASQFRLERTLTLLAPAPWTPMAGDAVLLGDVWTTTNAPAADAESFRLVWP